MDYQDNVYVAEPSGRLAQPRGPRTAPGMARRGFHPVPEVLVPVPARTGAVPALHHRRDPALGEGEDNTLDQSSDHQKYRRKCEAPERDRPPSFSQRIGHIVNFFTAQKIIGQD